MGFNLWPSKKIRDVRPQKHADHEASPATVRLGEKIADGGEESIGVYKAQLIYDGDRRKHRIPVVIKRFDGDEPEGATLERAELYNAMKRAGMRVAKTFRPDAAKRLAVVSDLNAEGHVALSCNNTSRLLKFNSLREIPQMKETFERMLHQVELGSDKGFSLSCYGYLLLLPDPRSTKGSVQTDFVIDDMGGVTRVHPHARGTFGDNLSSVFAFWTLFIGTWMEPEAGKAYVEQLRPLFHDAIARYAERLGDDAERQRYRRTTADVDLEETRERLAAKLR